MAAFFALAGACAVLDWIAIARKNRGLEYVCKPAVIVALIGAAATLDPAHDVQRALFIAALVLSIAGDIFLMLPGDRFIAGLAAFLLAHSGYIAGFATEGPTLRSAVIAALAVAAVSVPVGAWILRGARASSPRLVLPVTVYMLAISTMVAAALATGDPWAGAGALLFYASDALIAVGRFVVALRWARMAVIVTYHVGQGALVVSLLD